MSIDITKLIEKGQAKVDGLTVPTTPIILNEVATETAFLPLDFTKFEIALNAAIAAIDVNTTSDDKFFLNVARRAMLHQDNGGFPINASLAINTGLDLYVDEKRAEWLKTGKVARATVDYPLAQTIFAALPLRVIKSTTLEQPYSAFIKDGNYWVYTYIGRVVREILPDGTVTGSTITPAISEINERGWVNDETHLWSINTSSKKLSQYTLAGALTGTEILTTAANIKGMTYANNHFYIFSNSGVYKVSKSTGLTTAITLSVEYSYVRGIWTDGVYIYTRNDPDGSTVNQFDLDLVHTGKSYVATTEVGFPAFNSITQTLFTLSETGNFSEYHIGNWIGTETAKFDPVTGYPVHNRIK